MLRPISHPGCGGALAACQVMMRRFALWLCDSTTTVASLTQIGLQPPVSASVIEADWLWKFLQKVDSGHSLLIHAQTLAAMSNLEKSALNAWVNTVSALPTQFGAVPAPWPTQVPAINNAAWKAFKVLMEAFYEKAFKSARGLPFLANGTPTNTGGVTYAAYVQAFREAHRLNPDLNAREVCVLCGGPLGDTPHVDHWINKGAYPLLSICADNLQLICSTCNEAPNKGDKPVHSTGSFVGWFHPYLRPGHGSLQPTYVLLEMAVQCLATDAADQDKTDNLNQLLNLGNRWTREFKSEYAKHQDVLRQRERRRIRLAQRRHTQADIQAYVQQWQEDLTHSEPHHEVHQALAAALLESSRLAAWHGELALVT